MYVCLYIVFYFSISILSLDTHAVLSRVYIVTDATSRLAIPQSLKDLRGEFVELVTSDWLVETLLHGTIQNI